MFLCIEYKLNDFLHRYFVLRKNLKQFLVKDKLMTTII